MAEIATQAAPAASPTSIPQVPDNIGRFALEPINHAFAAASRKALEIGVPTVQVLEMHLNILASVVAMIEPSQARAAALVDVVRALPDLVRQHVDRRFTTSGGIKLPGAPI